MTEKTEDLQAVSVLHTRVMVNCGDHAQDVTNAVEVKPDETVAEVANRLLIERGYHDVPAYDDYLTIRLVKPADPEEAARVRQF